MKKRGKKVSSLVRFRVLIRSLRPNLRERALESVFDIRRRSRGVGPIVRAHLSDPFVRGAAIAAVAWFPRRRACQLAARLVRRRDHELVLTDALDLAGV